MDFEPFPAVRAKVVYVILPTVAGAERRAHEVFEITARPGIAGLDMALEVGERPIAHVMRLDRVGDLLHVRLARLMFSLHDRTQVQRQADGSQDGQDEYDDEQLDQRKRSIHSQSVHWLFPIRPDRVRI